MKKHLPILRMMIIGISGFRTNSILILPILLMIFLISPVLTAQPGQKPKDKVEFAKAADVPGFKSLVNERKPSIYIGSSGIKKDGNGSAQVVFASVESIATLYTSNTDFDNVKLISIKIEKPADKSISLDLGKLNSFKKLNYVLFSFMYDECGGESDACLEEKVRAMITGNMNGLIVVYQLSIPN